MSASGLAAPSTKYADFHAHTNDFDVKVFHSLHTRRGNIYFTPSLAFTRCVFWKPALRDVTEGTLKQVLAPPLCCPVVKHWDGGSDDQF